VEVRLRSCPFGNHSQTARLGGLVRGRNDALHGLNRVVGECEQARSPPSWLVPVGAVQASSGCAIHLVGSGRPRRSLALSPRRRGRSRLGLSQKSRKATSTATASFSTPRPRHPLVVTPACEGLGPDVASVSDGTCRPFRSRLSSCCALSCGGRRSRRVGHPQMCRGQSPPARPSGLGPSRSTSSRETPPWIRRCPQKEAESPRLLIK
jgi:hypothetical protein